jgi:hypothetical protein
LNSLRSEKVKPRARLSGLPTIQELLATGSPSEVD